MDTTGVKSLAARLQMLIAAGNVSEAEKVLAPALAQRVPFRLFEEYQVKKLVNVHQHVDDAWFWTKYSAHPYVGCRCGCEFCYLRDGYYTGRRDPQQLDTHIKVKVNAVERLRRELARLPVDVINCGDWQQPAEGKYQLSRQMLEALLEMGYPLLVIERSPLLMRDLDLLREIQRMSWVCVALSFSNVDESLKRIFEPRSPGIKRRLEMMAALAQAGILVGAALMPILPVVGDDRQHLEDAIRAFKDHGGRFVLAGGLTMAGIQARRSLEAAKKVSSASEAAWRKLYHWEEGGEPSHSAPRFYTVQLGRYELELEQQPDYHIWAYRKAAWSVDELSESLADIYHAYSIAGLMELPDVGKSIAEEIAAWLSTRDSIPPWEKGERNGKA